MKTLKFKYCCISGNTVTCSNKELDSPHLENVEISFNKRYIEIKGDKVQWDFELSFTFISEERASKIEDKYIKYEYKNIFDWIKGKKSPYLDGWGKLKERVPFHRTIYNYILQYE